MEMLHRAFHIIAMVFLAFGALFALGWIIMVLGALRYEFQKFLDNLPENLKKKDS